MKIGILGAGFVGLTLAGRLLDTKAVQVGGASGFCVPRKKFKDTIIGFEGVPTGVAVNQAMQHGGPFPATTDSRFTSVGSDAIYRWLRPIAFQDCPDFLLPVTLQNKNPLGILRNVNGILTTNAL